MKVALVTGGSRGIGRAICLALAKEGYHILINYVSNDRAAEECKQLIQELGGTAELLKFDVADNAACQEAIELWQKENPDSYISVLVNNAGIRKDMLMLRMDLDSWNAVINTNLNSFYNVTKPVLKEMLSHRHGRVINISSVSGITGLAGQTNYSAAKGAVIAATKALALELASRKITVNAVAPGFISTEMVEGLDLDAIKKSIPARRFGEPEEVAHLVAFLASDKASYISGQTISINGAIA